MRMPMEELLDEGTLLCRVDSAQADAEHSDQPCIRLVGVAPQDFNQQAFSRGVSAFVMDMVDPVRWSGYPCPSSDDCIVCGETSTNWLRVRFSSDQDGASGIYPAFGEGLVSKVSVLDVKPEKGFDLPEFPAFQPSHHTGKTSWKCSAFEVGQGMATLLYSDTEAYLIDAGAGTPIKQATYRAGKMVNELAPLVAARAEEVTFLLSHGDCDHWRLLKWDVGLERAIGTFVVPDGLRPIAFFDHAVRSRVRSCNSHLLKHGLGAGCFLDVYRTRPRPRARTSNNDGLIVVFSLDQDRVLVAGDCVYSDIRDDSDPLVQSLVSARYRGVVVPHHGDTASSQHVPPAASHVGCNAFFSAGDHQGYGHPTQSSIDQHVAAGYLPRSNKTPSGITEFVLL